MSFQVHTVKHRRGGREKIQDVHTVPDGAAVEKRLNAALRGGFEAWAENEGGEEVGRVSRDGSASLDRAKLGGR